MKPKIPPHPRPNNKIDPLTLLRHERTGKYVAQLKYNGTHLVCCFSTNEKYKINNLEFYDRRGKLLRSYSPSGETAKVLECLQLEKNANYMLNGELCHLKAKSKLTGMQALIHTIVLFDVLMLNNRYLSLIPFTERYDMLNKFCRSPKEVEPLGRGIVIRELGDYKLWLAPVFFDKFSERFEMYATKQNGEDVYPEIEGLVLKEKEGLLPSGDRLEDVDWIIRARKPKKNMYEF